MERSVGTQIKLITYQKCIKHSLGAAVFDFIKVVTANALV